MDEMTQHNARGRSHDSALVMGNQTLIRSIRCGRPLSWPNYRRLVGRQRPPGDELDPVRLKRIYERLVRQTQTNLKRRCTTARILTIG